MSSAPPPTPASQGFPAQEPQQASSMTAPPNPPSNVSHDPAQSDHAPVAGMQSAEATKLNKDVGTADASKAAAVPSVTAPATTSATPLGPSVNTNATVASATPIVLQPGTLTASTPAPAQSAPTASSAPAEAHNPVPATEKLATIVAVATAATSAADHHTSAPVDPHPPALAGTHPSAPADAHTPMLTTSAPAKPVSSAGSFPSLNIPEAHPSGRERSESSSTVKHFPERVDTRPDLATHTRSRRNSDNHPGAQKAEAPSGLVIPQRPVYDRAHNSEDDLKPGRASPNIPPHALV